MDTSKTPTRDAWHTFCQRVFCCGWYHVLQFLALAGAAVAWAACGFTDGWVRYVWIAIGFACIALEIWFSKLRTDFQKETMADQESALRAPLDESVREFSFFLESIESPILGRILQMIPLSRSEAKSQVAGIEESTLSMAMNVCGPRGVSMRALLFTRANDTLRVSRHMGGQRRSKSTFPKPGRGQRNEAAKRVWADAAKGEPVVYNDLVNSPPAGFTSPNSNYKSFMTCGILDENGDVVGMLNIDCPIVDGLSDADAIMLRTLCETLAIAYSVKRMKTARTATSKSTSDIQLHQGPAKELR